MTNIIQARIPPVINNRFPASLPEPWLKQWNELLEQQSATQRVEWAMENLPSQFVLSSSFGIQSAVMLHMLTQIEPNIPVLITDTGHLFPETYQFIEQMTERLKLNLQVFSAKESAAWQQAKYGQEWATDEAALKAYNRRSILRGRFKVHPIIDWTNKDVHQYLTANNLPYHPLWEEGYVSVGDVHSTRPLTAGMDESDTRFSGMQRECGLHTDGDGI